MNTEDIFSILVVVGVFLMIPVGDWLVRVVGERLHLFKRVYWVKGKACGREQVVVPFGDLFIWTFLKQVGFWLVFLGAVWLVETLLSVEIAAYVGLPSLVCAVCWISFSMQQFHKACLFCSERREEVEAYIEKKCQKNQYYRAMVSEIQYEDGLYMIFQAKPEKYQKAMEVHVKTYTRECPEQWRKLLSKRFYWTVVWVSLVLGVAMFLGSNWVIERIDWELPEIMVEFIGDIPEFLMLLFGPGPLFVLVIWKSIFAEKAIDKLRAEEGLSKGKYEVRCSMDRVDEGRLVFRVRERRLAEQEKIRHKDPF